MKNKLIVVLGVSFFLVGCQKEEIIEKPEFELNKQEMASICDLASVECYYHNVASYYEKDAEGMLFWKKDKHFWIEYDGYVEAGIDCTKMDVTKDDERNAIIITMPPAKILTDPRVDSSTLTSDSYYVDSTSAAVTQEDETEAFKKAQDALREAAENDSILLAQAEANAKTVLRQYVNSINEQIGTDYTVEFKMVEDEHSPAITTS